MSSLGKREPCTICGSTTIRPTIEGTFSCRNGHVLKDVRVEVNDVEDAGYTLLTKRTKGRNKKETNPMYADLNDDEMKYFILRIYQYALRLQIQSLISDHGFPAELSNVVKAFWGYYLDHNPHFQVDWSKVDPTELPPKSKPSDNQDITDPINDFEKSPSTSDEESSSSEEDEFNPDLSLDFDQLEDDHNLGHYHTIKWNLVLIYLACQYLRFPVLAIDIIALANHKDFPYNRLYSNFPKKFKRFRLLHLRLHAEVPSYEILHTMAFSLGKAFVTKYNVQFLPPSFSMYACRFLHHFGLPPSIYTVMKNIYESTKEYFDFSFSARIKTLETPEAYTAVVLAMSLKFIYSLGNFSNGMFSSLPTLSELLNSFESANRSAKFYNIPESIEEALRLIKIRPLATSNTLLEVSTYYREERSNEHSHRADSFKRLTLAARNQVQDREISDFPGASTGIPPKISEKLYPTILEPNEIVYQEDLSPESELLLAHLSSYFLCGDELVLKTMFAKLELQYFRLNSALNSHK